MRKSILTIICIICIIFMAILSYFPIFFSSEKEIYNYKSYNRIDKFKSQVTNMYFLNNNEILVEQTIDVKDCIPTSNNNNENEILNFEIPYYDVRNDKLFFNDFKDVKCNISFFNLPEYGSIGRYSMRILIQGLKNDSKQHNLIMNELERNNYKVIYSYKIDSKNLLSYSDNKENVILYLKGNNKFLDNNTLYIHLPYNTHILNKEKYIEPQENNIYKINLKRRNIDYEIRINGNLKTEITSELYNTKTKPYRDIYIILNCFSLMTGIFVVILSIVYILKRIKIKKGIYERETKNVIDPILAESIIDGKIDAKDLIMTCIVNLIYKKKIENIDNDSLKLIDVTELSDIEREVLSMLFITNDPIENSKGKVVKLSDFKNIFINENDKSLNIKTKFIEIKNIIKNKLYQLKILNKTWNIILNQIKIISVLIILNLIIILGLEVENVFVYMKEYFILTIAIIFINIFTYIMLLDKGVSYIMRLKTSNKWALTLMIFVVFFPIFILGFKNSLKNIDVELLKSFIILIIVNLIVFKLSHTYVLTKNGKEEYKKAYMLKKYIIDYSLIKQRDVDELILFDEYLIYATAFGIPSKITSKINEELLSINIKLQIISKILTM